MSKILLFTAALVIAVAIEPASAAPLELSPWLALDANQLTETTITATPTTVHKTGTAETEGLSGRYRLLDGFRLFGRIWHSQSQSENGWRGSGGRIGIDLPNSLGAGVGANLGLLLSISGGLAVGYTHLTSNGGVAGSANVGGRLRVGIPVLAFYLRRAPVGVAGVGAPIETGLTGIIPLSCQSTYRRLIWRAAWLHPTGEIGPGYGIHNGFLLHLQYRAPSWSAGAGWIGGLSAFGLGVPGTTHGDAGLRDIDMAWPIFPDDPVASYQRGLLIDGNVAVSRQVSLAATFGYTPTVTEIGPSVRLRYQHVSGSLSVRVGFGGGERS